MKLKKEIEKIKKENKHKRNYLVLFFILIATIIIFFISDIPYIKNTSKAFKVSVCIIAVLFLIIMVVLFLDFRK